MKVTISDVARLAGVSTATVSHTINNTRYVSVETKDKVYRAIAELGYTPDASARSFRTGKKKTVGFIVPDISNKFFATMIEVVENSLSAKGYHLIIANTKENIQREETNLRLLTAGLVDGILVASTMTDSARFDELIPAGFPVVLVDRTFPVKKYTSVTVSNFQPIYRAISRLAARGCRRVGLIAGLDRLSSTQERVTAYREAIMDCGLELSETLICYNDQQCDALLVCQGAMATTAFSCLNITGKAEGLELVGFVDYDAGFYDPYYVGADRIIQPVEALGQAAGEEILRRIEDPDAPIFEKVLTSEYKPYPGH